MTEPERGPLAAIRVPGTKINLAGSIQGVLIEPA